MQHDSRESARKMVQVKQDSYEKKKVHTICLQMSLVFLTLDPIS